MSDLSYYNTNEKAWFLNKITDEIFEDMSGMKIPALPQSYPLTLESRFTDLQQSLMGRILFNAVLRLQTSR